MGKLTVRTPGTIVTGYGSATQLIFEMRPHRCAWSGVAPFKPALVQLADVLGDLVSAGGVAVTVSITSGTGVLTGTTTRFTGLTGRAVFNDLVITGTGTHTLTFVVAGLTAAVYTLNVYTQGSVTNVPDTGNIDTNGTNLQAALDAASANETVTYVAGISYRRNGGFVLPDFGGAGVCMLRSTQTGSMPNARLDTVADGSKLGKLIGHVTGSVTAGVLSGEAGAHDWIVESGDGTIDGGGYAVCGIQLYGGSPAGNEAMPGFLFKRFFLHPPEATQTAPNDTVTCTIERGLNDEVPCDMLWCDFSGFAPRDPSGQANASESRFSVGSPGPNEIYDSKLESHYSSYFLGGGDTAARYTGTITAATLTTVTLTSVTGMTVGMMITMDSGFSGWPQAHFFGVVTNITGLIVTFIPSDHQSLVTKTPPQSGEARWRTNSSTVVSHTVTAGDATHITLDNVTGIVAGTRILAGDLEGTDYGSVWEASGSPSGLVVPVTFVMAGSNKFFVPALVGGTVGWDGYRWPANQTLVASWIGSRPAWFGAGGYNRKTLVEVKSANGLIVDGVFAQGLPNDYTGAFYAGGFSFLTYNQGGSAPWTAIRGVRWVNGFCAGGGGMQFQRQDPYYVTDQQSDDVQVENHVFEEAPSALRGFGVLSASFRDAHIRLRHITSTGVGSFIEQDSGPQTGENLSFDDSIVYQSYAPLCLIGGSYSGTPLVDCFSQSHFRNLTVNHNGDGLGSYGTEAALTMIGVASWAGVGFTDKAARNYKLTPASSSYRTARDGTDRGALLELIFAACNSADLTAGGIPTP